MSKYFIILLIIFLILLAFFVIKLSLSVLSYLENLDVYDDEN